MWWIVLNCPLYSSVNCQRLTKLISWYCFDHFDHTPPRAAWAAARAAKGAPGSFSGMDRSLRATWDMTQESTRINIWNLDQRRGKTGSNHEQPPWHPWLKISQDLENQHLDIICCHLSTVYYSHISSLRLLFHHSRPFCAQAVEHDGKQQEPNTKMASSA